MSTDRITLEAHESPEDLRRHAEMIGNEFFVGFATVDQLDRPAVSIFGSARVREGSSAYESARATGRPSWMTEVTHAMAWSSVANEHTAALIASGRP